MQQQTRAWLIKELGKFEGGAIMTDLGTLAQRAAKFPMSFGRQTDAWRDELKELANLAQSLVNKRPESAKWPFLMEYEIPRRQKRPDVILIAHNVIFVIEFKFGAIEFDSPDRWQVENYSLDLRDFHGGSAGKPIVPVLVATEARPDKSRFELATPNPMTVWRVQLAAPVKLSELILLAFQVSHRPAEGGIEALEWDGAEYKPSLNIIEAAQKLFAQHSVYDIKHAHSSNLDKTTENLVSAIQRARTQKLKLICFVTGVPGAGKTLTGLNAVHSPELPLQQWKEKNAPIRAHGEGQTCHVVPRFMIKKTYFQAILHAPANRATDSCHQRHSRIASSFDWRSSHFGVGPKQRTLHCFSNSAARFSRNGEGGKSASLLAKLIPGGGT
jgi:hypothetical protein